MAKIRLKYEGPHEGGVRLPTGNLVVRDEGDERPLHVVFPGEEVAVDEELAGWPADEETGDPGHGFLASDFWVKAKGAVSKVPQVENLDALLADHVETDDVDDDVSGDQAETEGDPSPEALGDDTTEEG